MKISVVIIAHNEEKHIEKCISSLLNQSVGADEIILVAHNCTDTTIEKAMRFPVIVKVLEGEKGIAYARYYGISVTSGDIILCTDGDSTTSPNWIETLSGLLDASKSMMAGTYVKYTGNLFWDFINPLAYIGSFIPPKKIYCIYGPSFGFTNKMKDLVLGCMKEFPFIYNQLSLHRYVDDFWMTINANYVYPLVFTRKATVVAISKERNFWDSFIRTIMNYKSALILKSFFKEQKLSELNNTVFKFEKKVLSRF
jgi:glycosyltransferase involved in cell wall biosynthesis